MAPSQAFKTEPGATGPALEDAYRRLEDSRFVEALRSRRLDVWTADRAVQEKIAGRLGWIDLPDTMSAHLPRLGAFSDSIAQSGFSDILLFGMGGSSLASEVMRAIIGVAEGRPRFHVVDTVDPDAVRASMERAATSLFILSSKSGSTIELTSLAAEAERRLRAAGIADVGAHFIAITDAGTPLERQARESKFRDVFVNPSDVGGRFSALSLFGLVPAVLMGASAETLLSSARDMAAQCAHDDPRQNPGLALGALMAAGALSGRDKLTVVMPATWARFGVWIEQLVAESTGKQGKGVVPIVDTRIEPHLRDDRTLVVMTPDRDTLPLLERARELQIPIATIDVASPADIGAEFYRWEVATAAAGFLLGVNPFDEPNVQQAKDATRNLLERYAADRRLPATEPDAAVDGARVAVTSAARTALDGRSALRFLDLLQPSDYFSLLAYLPPDDPTFHPALEDLCAAVTARSGCASALGYGPRYLHSTGQLHKGGPNTGVFIILTAAVTDDFGVPGQPYSFGVLEAAQALGDFQSLDRNGRRALHFHLPDRNLPLLQQVAALLLEGV